MHTQKCETPISPSAQQENNSEKNPLDQHEFTLSKREAEAACPDDIAVCGEEDPGEALEFLVTDNISDNQK